MALMKLRLDFPFKDRSQTVQNIFDGLYTQVFYSWAWVRRDVKLL